MYIKKMLDNIKSLKILNLVLVFLEKGKKLNLLKYNKRMQVKLDIGIIDIKNYIAKKYELLKELNEECELDIKDFEITILNLSHKRRINDIVEALNKFKFKEMKELNISSNYLEIDNLVKSKFEKLEI